jgi:hypothetical protein
MDSLPSFETRAKSALLRMRSEIASDIEPDGIATMK